VIAPGEPRLLALDLDGTLLGPDGDVPPRTRAAIERLRAGGVHVVLASGRAPAGMRRLCQELGLDDPQITMQGALIASPLTGSVLAAWRLEPAEARAHIAFAHQAGAVPLLCFADGFRSEVLTHELKAWLETYEEPLPLIVPNLDRLVEERPIKTYLYTPRGTHEQVWDAANRAFHGRATVTSGDEDSVELLPPGASKGKALRTLAAHLRIPLAEVAAIGDGRNDIAMLRLAGRSAAMAQARPEVREAADLVVPSNSEEGALEALERFYPSLAPLAAAASPATREA
jgi:Cof subfamily protein (haloacid dehalogenase superfamily)